MTRPPTIQCADCGVDVPVARIGQIPTRCPEHTKALAMAKDRARKHALVGKGRPASTPPRVVERNTQGGERETHKVELVGLPKTGPAPVVADTAQPPIDRVAREAETDGTVMSRLPARTAPPGPSFPAVLERISRLLVSGETARAQGFIEGFRFARGE